MSGTGGSRAPMGAIHDEVRDALGAYVLGALEPVERAAVDAHLGECVQCREALTELASLPGLLGRLSTEEVTGGFEPPSTRPVDEAIRIIGQEQRGRRRRLRAWQTLAAAALVAIIALLLPGLLSQTPTPSLVLQPQAAAPDAGEVEGFVAVTATDWGMEVELELRNLPARQGYSLIAVAEDDHRAPAASWSSTDTGEVTLSGSCYLALERLVRMEVVTPDGEVVTTFEV